MARPRNIERNLIMSHFTIGIIVPPQTVLDRRNLERFIQARMAPFDENRLFATFNHEGEHCRVYNPDGRWDYYKVGGHWNGWLTDMPPEQAMFRHNVAPVEDVIENEKWPSAFITPKGLWIESDTDRNHIILHTFPDHYVVLVDAHA